MDIKKLVLFLILCSFLCFSFCQAEIFSVALSKTNSKESWRKKEADIVAVQKGNASWGTEERKLYFIVLVDFGTTLKTLNDARSLVIPLYESGDLTDSDVAQVTLAKKRFRIDFAHIASLAAAQGIILDMDKLRNEKLDYQPLLDAGISIICDNIIYCKYAERELTGEDLTLIKNGIKIDAP